MTSIYPSLHFTFFSTDRYILKQVYSIDLLVVVVAFFLAYEDFGEMFDHSFLACERFRVRIPAEAAGEFSSLESTL